MTDTVPIRSETPKDHSAIRHVNQQAFGCDAEAELVDALRDGGLALVSLVAEFERQIVGHILFSPVRISGKNGTAESVPLAPMSVLPEFQRQKIGSKLLMVGVTACQAMGHRSVLVLGHPEFYAKFGFSARLAEPLENPFGGGEAWMAMELVSDSLKGVEGRVEYPAPFNALE